MKKFLHEFKTFAMRGNVMDMAVGVILGSAFGKIVSSLVADVIMPVVGLLVGGVNFMDLKMVLKAPEFVDNAINIPAVTINYGMFLQTIFDFLIVAFCIFLMIKGINRLSGKINKEEVTEEVPAPAEPSDEVKLLEEIRDLLKTGRTPQDNS